MRELKMAIVDGVARSNREFYIFDDGEVARTISKIYGRVMPIAGFITDEASLNAALQTNEPYIVVGTNKSVDEIFDQLRNAGLTIDRDFCHYKEWIRKYFEVVLNDEHKLLQDYVELYITDRCTLRCKACILFAPYAAPPRDRSFSDIRRDIELYFKYVDRVSVFRLMGGEPFIHPHFADIIKFIDCERGGQYRELIGSMIVVSNGTVIPPPHVLRMLSEFDIEVHVSDYPVPAAQHQREKLIEAFEREHVRYKIKPMRWVDVNSNPTAIKHKSRRELLDLFRKCFVRCRTVYDGKLYFCAIDAAAQRRQFITGDDDDFVELDTNEEVEAVKKRILTLDAGKLGKGYVSFCRNCWGGTDSNERIIPVAEQL